jgi:hypothetical protein
MSAMVNLEIPWINIMSKMDLVTANTENESDPRNGIRQRKDIARYVLGGLNSLKHTNATLYRYLDPDPMLLATRRGQEGNIENPRFHALNQAIVHLVCALQKPLHIAH